MRLMNRSFGAGHQIGSHWFINLKFSIRQELIAQNYQLRNCPHQNSLVASQPHAPNGAELKGQKSTWFYGEVSKNPSVSPLTLRHLLTNTAAFTLSLLSVDSAPPLATPCGACCCLRLKARL